MKCTKCGHNITKKQAFCSACGAEAPELPPKNPFPVKIVLCIALALSVIVNIVLLLPSGFSSQQIEGKGFDSPEAAATAYIEAMRECDVDKMISTFAVESYLKHFSLEGYIKKYRAIMFDTNLPLPSGNIYNEEVNKYIRLSEISTCIRRGYLELIGFDYVRSHFWNDDDEREEIINNLTVLDLETKMSHINVYRAVTEEYFDYNKNDYDRQIDDIMSYLNVTDLCDVAIDLEFDGEKYYLFMLTAKINGNWYNIRTAGPLMRVTGTQVGGGGGFVKHG